MIGGMMPIEFVQESIQKGFSWAKCDQIHPDSCNKFCLNYVLRVSRNTYKTYGAVYIIQLLFKFKTIAKDPIRQIPRFLLAYIKSTSLTAVQMMIMRRILCFLNKYHRNGQNNLIWANFFSAFYILIEPMSRQCEIALYQLNNTSLVIYNMALRRKMIKSLPYGECLLFALAITIITFHYFNHPQALKKNYVHSICEKLIGSS